MCVTIDMWNDQQPQRHKCQYCKEEKDCKRGPDPYLYYQFDEIEMVWLCQECYDLRKDGSHLGDDEDDE